MLIEDLARDAADLLSVGNSGQMRSLNRLAELAVREVAGCCGATAILWRDRELVGLTSTHPDLAELAEFQLKAGHGPAIQALRDRQPVTIRDTLRKLSWDHVDLDKGVINVWRSASRTGDVKTPSNLSSILGLALVERQISVTPGGRTTWARRCAVGCVRSRSWCTNSSR